jgi:magnesium transporter
MVDVWEVHGQGLVHHQVDAERAAEMAEDPTSVVWIEISADDFRPLAVRLDLHPQAVEDALHHVESSRAIAQRTKLERYPRSALLYLFRAELDDSMQLSLYEAPLLVTRHSVIAVQHPRSFDLDELMGRWEQNPQLLEQGVPALLYGTLDLVVDSYLDVVDGLSEEVDRLEDLLFDGPYDPTEDPLASQRSSFAARKALVRLRRVAQPMRELVSGLMRHDEGDRPSVAPVLQPYYQDVYDHVLRINDTIEGLRDLLTTIYETRLAMNDHSLNTVTRQLAAWAAIIAVPTAVTGFYGQNIPYPGFGDHNGFWTSTIIWVGVSVVLFFMFKRRRWL